MNKKDNKIAFIKEYDKLCQKHGVFIISEDHYCGVELVKSRTDEDVELHQFLLKQLKVS